MAPVLIGVAIAATLAGGAMGAVQSIRQGQAQAEEANMNANLMEQNARLEDRRMDRELAENRRRFNQLKGSARAQSGALGMFGGSSLDILADMDNQQVFEQTALVDERTSAQQNFYNQSAAYKTQAKYAKSNGTLGAIGSVVGSFGSAAMLGAGGLGKTGGTGSGP